MLLGLFCLFCRLECTSAEKVNKRIADKCFDLAGEAEFKQLLARKEEQGKQTD